MQNEPSNALYVSLNQNLIPQKTSLWDLVLEKALESRGFFCFCFCFFFYNTDLNFANKHPHKYA